MGSNGIQRVFILGMDGAGNFIQNTETPIIDAFLKKGAYTYMAQAQSPTISAECWGSILHGVTPEKHRLNNEAAATTTFPGDSPYPSIFRLAREAWPEAKLAAFSSWRPINSGIIEEDLGIHKESLPDAELVGAIESYLEQNRDVKLLFMSSTSRMRQGINSATARTPSCTCRRSPKTTNCSDACLAPSRDWDCWRTASSSS